MQPWTEALLKCLSNGSVHAGYMDGFTGIYVCIVGSGHYADLALQAHSS